MSLIWWRSIKPRPATKLANDWSKRQSAYRANINKQSWAKKMKENEAEVWKRGFFYILATSPLGLYKSHLNGKLNQMEEGPPSNMRHTQPMGKKILLFDVILKFNSRKCIIAITRTLQWLSSLRFLSPRMTARKSGSYLKSNQPSLKLNVCVFHRCTLSSKLKVHWEESVLKICEGLKGTLS